MRKIKILMAIFLSLFVMVILQSCEKERVEEIEQEHQEEIVTTDGLLGKESAMFWHIKRYWGTYYITDEHADVILSENYYIANIYVYTTEAESVSEKIFGLVTIPVDINRGCTDDDAYRVFLVLDIRRDRGASKYIKSFSIARYNYRPGIIASSDYLYSRYVYYYRRTSFGIDECNLNRGTKGGDYMYMLYQNTTNKNESVRAIRVTYSTNEEYAKSVQLNGLFSYENKNMNSGNSSPIKIYFGWRHF